MSHDEGGAVCLCVADHRPGVLELQSHHRLPLYLGGPDIPENRVWLCPTAHANVHELLRVMLRDGPLTWGQVLARWDRPVSRYAFALAHQALALYRSGGTL